MTYREIMAWGRRWHYPYLRIGDEASPPTTDVLRHGKEHYEELRNHPTRRKLTSLRIERWMLSLTRVQVSQAIEKIDDVLAKQQATKVQLEEERIEV